MRLFPAVNILFLSAFLGAVAGASPAFAQTTPSSDNSAVRAQLEAAMAGGNPQISPAAAQQVTGSPVIYPREEVEMTDEELAELLKDPESPQAKAHLLARQAKEEGAILNFAETKQKEDMQSLTDEPAPPEMEELQNVHETHGTDYGIADGEADDELLDLDLRRDAQKEAALSYGARGGLAKRSYHIAYRLKAYEHVLDKVFDFRALLIKAPSGLLIEPPIVRETLDTILITANGNEAAVADRVLDINKQAKIVSAPRDWRQYLDTGRYKHKEIPPPPKILWPRDEKEQASWNAWVRQGWKAGYEQGEETFETNLNRLLSDYNGMVRYRMLLTEGMISQPYALHEDRGVTGGKSEMRVGDRALRITGPSQFLTGSDLWKPADR